MPCLISAAVRSRIRARASVSVLACIRRRVRKSRSRVRERARARKWKGLLAVRPRCWLRRPSLYLAGFALYGYQTIVRQAFRRIRRRFPRLSDLPSFYCLSSFQPESENRLRFLAIFSIFKRNLHNCIFDLAKIVARLKEIQST